MESQLTGNDESSSRGAESSFTGKSVLGSAAVRFVTVFRCHVADVELAGRKHHVLAI